jgi:hypothetical protein
MFCTLGLIFGGTEGVGFNFHVLRARTLCRRYRGRPILFSFFPLLDMFSAVPWASGAVFMFCATRLIFGGTEGIRSHFHFSRSRACFRRYGGRRVPFSCFARPDSFFGGTKGVGSKFPILRSRIHFRCYPGASGTVYLFCAPGLIFGGTNGVRSDFHVLRSRTHFWRYRRRRVPFSCFALPNSFSAVPRASGLVFIFCGEGLIFGSTECVGSRFHVLRAQIRFRRYRGSRVPFSCFALLDSFSMISKGVGSRFHVLGGTEGFGSRFHVLRSRTRFRQYRFVGTEGVGSCFHVLRSRTHFLW